MLECYNSIIRALDKLATNSYDSSITAAASSLIQNLRCMVHYVHYISAAYISHNFSSFRMLQGAAADLSAAAILVGVSHNL